MPKPHYRYNNHTRSWDRERAILAATQPILAAQVEDDDVDDEGRVLARELESFMAEHPAFTGQRTYGRRSAPNAIAMDGRIMNAVQTRYTGSQADADMGGFQSVGEFLNTVRAAAPDREGATGPMQRKAMDRLRNAALTTYGNETVGADGGYAVPPTFHADIMQKVEGEDSLASYCDRIPISGNTLTVPKDETAPWNADAATNGIRAYWTPEAGVTPQRKPVLEESTTKLSKLTALVPMTEELLEDAPAMAGYVTKRAGEVIVQKLNGAIVAGSGAGQPLGILNSGVLITQAKESSQIAGTIHGLNLIKMWSRMPPIWRRSAVWLLHPDSVPAMMQAGLQVKSADGATAVGGSLLWIPGGTIANQPHDSIMGRPVIYTQECSALGEVGDIIFADLSQYALIERAGGARAETSIHLWFDQGVTAFKFTYRVNGQPWYSQPLADKNGSTTRSPFIALEAR